MWIKLIAPRVTMRPMDSAWKTQMSPPLSLLVIAALTPSAHEVTVADENIEKISLDDHPDLVGITVKVDTMYRAVDIAARYRKKGIPVVMGGIHATACPEDCLPHCDAVVVGEAEQLWGDVLNDVILGRLKKEYRNSGTVDIAAVPVPRWESLSDRKYLFTNTLRIGRGCPWRCDFCYNSAANVAAGYRMKPVDNIIEEIKSLGVNHVMFIDDNFIGNPSLVRQLLPKLKKRKLTWHTAVSADIVKHDGLLSQMAEAGCKSLFIGFESVNQKNLLGCHKKQNRIAQYDTLIARIHECGMLVNASLVFGFDDDDESVFPNTLQWLMTNRVASMTAHILTPYPGTRLHERLTEEGRIVDRDLRHYNTAHAVFRPLRMTADALETGYLDIYRRFYSWAGILGRWPVAHSQTAAYLQFNLIYRKYGKATCLLGKLFGMRTLSKMAKALAYPTPGNRGTTKQHLPTGVGTDSGMTSVGIGR